MDNLFNLLPKVTKKKHTLVLFDINHNFDRNNAVKSSVLENLQALRDSPTNENYNFELISNIGTSDRSVKRIVRHKEIETLPYQ